MPSRWLKLKGRPGRWGVQNASWGGRSSGGDLFKLSASLVTENTATGTTIGVLSTAAAGSWTPALVGGQNAGGRVAISGNNLQTTATPFNYETATSYTIQVIWTGPGAVTETRSFVITVVNVFETTLTNPLTFGASTFGVSTVEDAVLFAITGLSTGSTRTLIPDTGQIKITGSNIVRGASSVSIDEVVSGFIREAHTDAAISPVLTAFSFTVTDDSVAAVTLAANSNVLSTLSVDLLTSKSTGTYTSQKAGCHRSTNFIATGTTAAVEVNPASWSNIRRIGFGTALFDVRVDTTEDRLGSTSAAAAVFGNNGGSAQFRLNGADTQIALSSTPLVPATFGTITSGTWTRLEVDNNTGGAAILRIIKSDGTTISAPLTLPTGDMFLIIEHDTSNSPGADVTVNFGDNASGTFTDAQGKKWFVNPGARGYLAIPGTSGGGGSSVNAANASELVTKLGTAVSGQTINLTTAGANYGNITLSSVTFASNITIQYTGGGTRPVVDYIDLTTCDHITFKGFEVKRTTTGQSVRMDSTSHHITLDDVAVTAANVRNSGTGAITFGGVGLSGGNPGVGLIDILACANITIKNCTFTKCSTGVNISTASTFVVVQDNVFHDHYADGVDIQAEGTHHITVIGNTGTDLFAVAGDHQDFIQCNTLGLTNPIHDITILNNAYTRGSGYAAQGIFMGSEQERNLSSDPAWYQDILISGNTIEGGLQNGIVIGCGDRVELSNNVVRGYAAANPDPGQPIVIVSGMSIEDCSAVTYTGNQSQSWSSAGFNAGTAAPPNTTTTYVTTASGNTTVSAI